MTIGETRALTTLASFLLGHPDRLIDYAGDVEPVSQERAFEALEYLRLRAKNECGIVQHMPQELREKWTARFGQVEALEGFEVVEGSNRIMKDPAITGHVKLMGRFDAAFDELFMACEQTGDNFARRDDAEDAIKAAFAELPEDGQKAAFDIVSGALSAVMFKVARIRGGGQ